MEFDYDLIVIGSGPAGEKGAAQAAYFGKRVAVIEQRPTPGGASVHTGTIPSKTLRETALVLSGHRQRNLYGLNVSLDPDLAVQKLLSRKDAVRDGEVRRISANLDRHNVTVVPGHAALVDGHTVEVVDGAARALLTAEVILVATGSSPHRPESIDFSDPAIDESDTILGIHDLPRRLVILGGGVIGCEYASIFAELGVQVTLIEPREGLLLYLDREIARALEEALARLGVDVQLGKSWSAVSRSGGVLSVHLESGAVLNTDRVLVTAGRSGNTAGLNLEALGVGVGPRGHITVDKDYRTAVPSIFAAGDVIGVPGLAATSMEQARVAVCRAFGFDYKQQMGALLPVGVYTIPELSSVGLGEEEAAASGIDAVSGRASFASNARANIAGAGNGLLKLVFDRSSRKLIGTHVIGEQAAELVHIGHAVMVLGGTVETLLDMVFNHPTLAETYKYAAYDALGHWERQPEPAVPAAASS